MDTGEKTRRRAGEAKAFLNCGQTALKVSTVQELRELQQSMAKYKNLKIRKEERECFVTGMFIFI